MYKMTKNLTNVDTSDKLLPLQRPSRNCNTLAFSIPLCKASIRKESSYPKPTKDWNALKNASVGAPSIEAFNACLRQEATSAVFNLTVNIPHKLLVFTCAQQKLQNSQSDDGDRSTEEEEVVNDISRNLCNLQSYVYSL